jgi:Rrf2 family protein
MKISTKGRYGVKAIMDMAIHKEEGVIPLKQISERQNISDNYLEQLLAKLRKNNIVKSVRGAYGGYYLAKDIENITIGEILRALEGSIAPVECVSDNHLKYCENKNNCVTKSVWEKIKNSIDGVIDSITVKDLIDEYNKSNSNDNYMYYI